VCSRRKSGQIIFGGCQIFIGFYGNNRRKLFPITPKVIAAKSWSTFTNHPKPLKIILFLAKPTENKPYFLLIIFGSQIPPKIGHNHRK
jgi:hypothetical protein